MSEPADTESAATTPSIRYCKGHGWQVLAGEVVTIETIKECERCTVRQTE